MQSEQEQQDGVSQTMNPVDNKIMTDLGVVSEKMDLLDSMLKTDAGSPAPSFKNQEALLQVIGFLEACAPRMIELVEAAAQGALSGDVLEKCLQVNDRLLKQLTEVDTLALTESPASTTAASVPVQGMSDLFLDESNDNGDEEHQFAEKPPAATKSTGVEDDDYEDIFGERKTAATDSAEVGVSKKDSFDDFFEERHANTEKKQ